MLTCTTQAATTELTSRWVMLLESGIQDMPLMVYGTAVAACGTNMHLCVTEGVVEQEPHPLSRICTRW